AEAASHVGGHDGFRVNVGDGAAAELGARVRVVVGGPGWLGHQRSEQPVTPGVKRVHVVVEVRRAELHVRIPAVTNELRAYDLARRMREAEAFVENQSVAFDALDPPDLECPVL